MQKWRGYVLFIAREKIIAGWIENQDEESGSRGFWSEPSNFIHHSIYPGPSSTQISQMEKERDV